MRLFTVISLFLAVFVGVADAAVPQQRRGQSAANTATATGGATATTSARAAVSARAARTAPAAATTSATTGARAAVSARAGKTQTTAATTTKTTASSTPAVSARAGKTQKVVNAGTKVTEAAQNTIVNDECRQKYNGCMDSFCMLDNISGGRCLCSDRYTELETVRTQIAELDSRSYKLATVGVERIEMGDAADAVIKNVENLAQSVLASGEDKKAARKKLTNSWTTTSDEDDDIFGLNDTSDDPLAGKEGAALFGATHSLCAESIPECKSEMSMLQKLYSQQIRSDCAAYENSLEKSRKESQTKLATAEQTLREAALEQYQNSNKYDLGQCTVKFKECMMTTGGCNDDFSGCVGIAAAENAKRTKTTTSAAAAQHVIQGAATQITIAASSYDALESKKPLCFETVTKNCTRVKDQVWDTFIKEIAPTIKTAELSAESNLRQSCMQNISDCIANACKDTIDPNDKDGSYDLCLSRPDTVRSLCKVQIDPCEAAEPDIMKFVTQRLAGMRVNECTNQIKNCLQNDNRCGKDYQNCIGLSLNAMNEMCPISALTACTGDTDIAEYNNILQGIYLNIDNAIMKQCQETVNAKLIEVCGDTTTCSAFDDDTTMGAESIVSYTDSNGNYVIDGLMSYNELKTKKVSYGRDKKSPTSDVYFTIPQLDILNYIDLLVNDDNTSAGMQDKIEMTLNSIDNKIQQRISLLINDPYVSRCLVGNDNAGNIRKAKGNNGGSDISGYPHILDYAMSMIITSALDRANKNYTKKYNDLVAEALESQNDSIKAATCAAMAGSFNKSDAVCATYGTVDGQPVCESYKTSYPFSGLMAEAGSNGPGMYKTKQIISGINLEKSLEIISSGRAEYVQTDAWNNMLGRIVVAATYQAQTNTCVLTTTTTMCANAEQIKENTEIDMRKAKTSKNAYQEGAQDATITFGNGDNVFQASAQKIKDTTIKYETFVGVSCTKFNEPIVTTQNIKM